MLPYSPSKAGKTTFLMSLQGGESAYDAENPVPILAGTSAKGSDLIDLSQEGQRRDHWFYDSPGALETICGKHFYETLAKEEHLQHRPGLPRRPILDCFVMCFSIGSRAKFNTVSAKWAAIKSVHPAYMDTPLVLAGLQCDLRDSGAHSDCVSFDEGKALAEAMGAVTYMECSAKNFVGLREVWDASIEAVIDKRARSYRPPSRCVLQ